MPVASKSKAPAAPKTNAKKGGKPTSKKTGNNNNSSGNDDDDGSDEDGEGEGFDEGSEPEDPLAKYEKMRDQIQHERVVRAHLLPLSAHTHVERQPARKHCHRGQDSRTQDLRAMFTPGEINNQATKEVKKGHFCHACM